MFRRFVFIGRTNTGKSSLINTLIRKSECLVADIEDLTVDVVDRYFENSILTDTPGIDESVYFTEKIIGSDYFFLVFDFNFDIKLFNKLIRVFGSEKVALIINKSDTMPEKPNLPKIKTFFVSAKTGEGVTDLRKYIKSLSKSETISLDNSISFLGRSNVGKSSLVNSILKQERFLVKDEVGTTRDIAESRIGQIKIIDTPGYRKGISGEISGAVQKKIEEYIKNHKFTIGVIVLSALDGLTTVDKFLINKIMNSGFVIVCINKIDLVEFEYLQILIKYIYKIFPNIEVITCSTISGDGIGYLLSLINKKLQKINIKIKTSELNKVIHQQPELSTIKYITQTGSYSFKVFAKKTISKQKLRFLEKVILNLMDIKGICLNFDVVV